MFGMLTSACARECLGVALAAITAVAFGALYYSDLMFLPVWRHYSNRPSTKEGDARARVRLRLASLALNLVTASVLAKVMGVPGSAVAATLRGAIVGAGLVATSLAHNYLFSSGNCALLALDGGFYTAQYALMGLVLYLADSPMLFAK